MASPALVEGWTYVVLSTLLIMFRTMLRWRTQGFRGLAVDDYLMAAAVPLSMAGSVAAFVIETDMDGQANNGLTAAERAALDPDGLEWRVRVRASQVHLGGWLLYTALLWAFKLCWLFYYRRLGDRVDRMTLKVNLGLGFCAGTYLVVLCSILLGCRPFARHWQINPDPGNFCYPAVSRLQSWTVVLTNMATDLYIMSIPLPMIWRARISTPKKTGLGAMFCCGLITIGFGAARCGLILRESDESADLAARWSDRETFVGTVLTNVPVLFPLVRQHLGYIRDASRRGYNTKGESTGSRGDGAGLELPTMSVRSRGGKGQSFSFHEHGSEEAIVGIPNHSRYLP